MQTFFYELVFKIKLICFCTVSLKIFMPPFQKKSQSKVYKFIVNSKSTNFVKRVQPESRKRQKTH